MAGGGSLIRGIDRLVAGETGLPVHLADDPMSAVAEGTGPRVAGNRIPETRRDQRQILILPGVRSPHDGDIAVT